MKKRKIVLIGCGLVGMSYAYSLLITGDTDELALIDLDKKRLAGEIDDLCHALPFAEKNTEIYIGSYSDCKDADIVVITAGAAQKVGEGRISLLKRNRDIFSNIIPHIISSGFDGIMIIATNPVDLMSAYARELSGLPYTKVIGSGTTLDSGRLKFLLGSYFNIDPKSVNAYVMGEHGDSEFVPWSQALISTVPIKDMCERSSCSCTASDLIQIEDDVRNAAYVVIKAKNATYYGIGMSLVRLVRAIFNDERSVLTVSTHIDGQYDEKDVYIGIPSVVGRTGVVDTMPIDLTKEELKKFHNSCDVLRKHYNEIDTTKTVK